MAMCGLSIVLNLKLIIHRGCDDSSKTIFDCIVRLGSSVFADELRESTRVLS